MAKKYDSATVWCMALLSLITLDWIVQAAMGTDYVTAVHRGISWSSGRPIRTNLVLILPYTAILRPAMIIVKSETLVRESVAHDLRL